MIFENDDVIAFLPLEEVSKGHTLLITKKHFENILDVEEELFSRFARVLKRLSIKLIQENNATGINLLNANGKDAQQSVFHIHFHLVPRYPHDGLDLWIKNKL